MSGSALTPAHASPSTLRRMRRWGRRNLSQPQQLNGQGQIASVFTICIAGLGLVLVGETAALPGVTLGSYALLAVLLATWTLPTPWANAVVAAAIAVVVAAVVYGSVDRVTGGFQLAAVVIVASVGRFGVIALQRSERRRSALHRQLLNIERERADELRRLNARLVEFTADAAHELRAPLAIMRTATDRALARPRLANEYQESLLILQREVVRLSRISETLLVLARADEGQLALQKEAVDVADFLGDVAARWQATVETRGLVLELDLPEDGVVRADQLLLARLFDNLVDNACRYTSPGGAISLAARADRSGWHISVANGGVGIPPELRDHIFERFKRGDPSRARDTGGAGLGLALCQTIAQLHGGGVALDEPMPGITRFTVDLP